MRAFPSATCTAALITIAAPAIALAAPVEWPVSAGGNGHRYEAVAQMLTWDNAQAHAERRGGHLVTLASQAEFDFVLTLTRTREGNFDGRIWMTGQDGRRFGPWIGAQQAYDERNSRAGWSWITGEPFDFTAWHTGEPNDWAGQREDVAVLFHHPSEAAAPGWNDDVRLNRRTYIVEYEPAVAVAPSIIEPATRPATSEVSAPQVSSARTQPRPSAAAKQQEGRSFRQMLGVFVLIVGLIGTPIVGFVVYFACRMALRHHDRRK